MEILRSDHVRSSLTEINSEGSNYIDENFRTFNRGKVPPSRFVNGAQSNKTPQPHYNNGLPSKIGELNKLPGLVKTKAAPVA
jgi:hypothetical protein